MHSCQLFQYERVTTEKKSTGAIFTKVCLYGNWPIRVLTRRKWCYLNNFLLMTLYKIKYIWHGKNKKRNKIQYNWYVFQSLFKVKRVILFANHYGIHLVCDDWIQTLDLTIVNRLMLPLFNCNSPVKSPSSVKMPCLFCIINIILS